MIAWNTSVHNSTLHTAVVYVTFFSSRCMLELKIFHRTASLSSWASSEMYAVLAEESLTRLCSNTESTMDVKTLLVFMQTTVFLIQQFWIVIVLLLSDLSCAKTIMKESQLHVVIIRAISLRTCASMLQRGAALRMRFSCAAVRSGERCVCDFDPFPSWLVFVF